MIAATRSCGVARRSQIICNAARWRPRAALLGLLKHLRFGPEMMNYGAFGHTKLVSDVAHVGSFVTTVGYVADERVENLRASPCGSRHPTSEADVPYARSTILPHRGVCTMSPAVQLAAIDTDRPYSHSLKS